MRRKPIALALLAVLALVLVACAEAKKTGFPEPKEKSPTAEESPGPTGTEPVPYGGQIEVVDNDFAPKVVTVKAGTEVLWKQTGTLPHSVTADDKSFDSHPDCLSDTTKCMQKDDEYERTFEEKGRFPYYCQIHGSPGGNGMAGELIVE